MNSGQPESNQENSLFLIKLGKGIFILMAVHESGTLFKPNITKIFFDSWLDKKRKLYLLIWTTIQCSISVHFIVLPRFIFIFRHNCNNKTSILNLLVRFSILKFVLKINKFNEVVSLPFYISAESNLRLFIQDGFFEK